MCILSLKNVRCAHSLTTHSSIVNTSWNVVKDLHMGFVHTYHLFICHTFFSNVSNFSHVCRQPLFSPAIRNLHQRGVTHGIKTQSTCHFSSQCIKRGHFLNLTNFKQIISCSALHHYTYQPFSLQFLSLSFSLLRWQLKKYDNRLFKESQINTQHPLFLFNPPCSSTTAPPTVCFSGCWQWHFLWPSD